MQFSDIKFIEHGGRYGSSKGFRIHGYWVFQSTIEDSWYRVCKGLPSADCRAEHTAKSMYGEDDWIRLSFGMQLALGRSVKFFVDHEMLPLKVSNPTKKGARKYIRTSPFGVATSAVLKRVSVMPAKNTSAKVLLPLALTDLKPIALPRGVGDLRITAPSRRT